MSELWALLTAALAAGVVLLMLHETDAGASRRRAGLRRLRQLMRRRRPESQDEGADAAVLLDLTAALLSAGVGIEAALSRLADTVPGAGRLARVHHALSAGAGWEQAVEPVTGHPELSAFCEHLSFAYATGAPSASMLRAAAAQARAQRRHGAERRAEELGVKMMLPLGACFLPAFILLGVVPVVLSMLPDSLGL
ncbi:type II secretion system F family protein [Garicola koreensis]|uniref:Pilus assembly protein TadC n=1 Tax=Garicola koreensis TaxID=1262554 RepID=A0A7W5TTQ3_9MICC|nr:type II secretion system F family protein [Garicola koreensis]MBB3668502.1 pilus assembly protein TadC [Garicola koreensis]